MPINYPPSGPVITDGVLTIHSFLQSPTAVQERVRDLAGGVFIADTLFPTGVPAGGGAVSYQVSSPLVTDRDPSAVAPGGEYELALAQGGVSQLAEVTKYGQDVRITDESIGRLKIAVLDRALRQVVNRARNFIDTLALAVAAAAITQTYTSTNAWNTAGADPLLDVMLAGSSVENTNLEMGFEPNLLLVTGTLYSRLASNKGVVAGLQANNSNSVVTSGQIQQIGGKRVVSVPDSRMPAGVPAMLVDPLAFGSYAYEDIPSPEYQGAASGIQTFTRRDPKATDSYLVRGRRTFVPLVENPGAAIKLLGL